MKFNPATLKAEETLSRFLLSKRFFDEKTRIISFSAFLPHKGNELSAFRTSGLNEVDIWPLGFEQLSQPDRIYGRGDLKAFQITSETPLTIEPETSKHSRHANILSWPPEDLLRQTIAEKLALKATLQMNRDPENPNKKKR